MTAAVTPPPDCRAEQQRRRDRPKRVGHGRDRPIGEAWSAPSANRLGDCRRGRRTCCATLVLAMAGTNLNQLSFLRQESLDDVRIEMLSGLGNYDFFRAHGRMRPCRRVSMLAHRTRRLRRRSGRTAESARRPSRAGSRCRRTFHDARWQCPAPSIKTPCGGTRPTPRPMFRAAQRVRFHDVEFVLRQLPRLEQDRIGDRDFANVMQRTRVINKLHIFVVQRGTKLGF